MQSGTDWTGTYVRAGKVIATNLSNFCHRIWSKDDYDCNPPAEEVHGVVHAYGGYAFGSLTPNNYCGEYSTIDDILESRSNPKYYCRRTPGQQEFAYRFLEYNPRDHHRTYPYLTNRTIAASGDQCRNYSIVHIEPGTETNSKWSNYTYTDGASSDTILLPVQVDTFDGTVYIYRGSKTPEYAETYGCGDRCILMWAYKTHIDDNEEHMFYQCAVSVNLVQNAQVDEHRVSNGIARLAAASIGLQGGKSDDENGWTQFGFYPFS